MAFLLLTKYALPGGQGNSFDLGKFPDLDSAKERLAFYKQQSAPHEQEYRDGGMATGPILMESAIVEEVE